MSVCVYFYFFKHIFTDTVYVYMYIPCIYHVYIQYIYIYYVYIIMNINGAVYMMYDI